MNHIDVITRKPFYFGRNLRKLCLCIFIVYFLNNLRITVLDERGTEPLGPPGPLETGGLYPFLEETPLQGEKNPAGENNGDLTRGPSDTPGELNDEMTLTLDINVNGDEITENINKVSQLNVKPRPEDNIHALFGSEDDLNSKLNLIEADINADLANIKDDISAGVGGGKDDVGEQTSIFSDIEDIEGIAPNKFDTNEGKRTGKTLKTYFLRTCPHRGF